MFPALHPSRTCRPEIIARPCATAASDRDIVRSIVLDPAPQGLEASYSVLFTPEAIQFVAELAATFSLQIDQLYWQRLNRKCANLRAFQKPQFLDSPERRDPNWKISPVPARLQNRHLDLGDVSPANTSHFVNSLQADVQGVQVDFDDGHCPTWQNQIIGLHNVYRVVHGQIPGLASIQSLPVLMLRPRAWNMAEHNMMVNGKEVPGPIFDFGILMFHNANKLSEMGCGPFFYLSKVEGAGEAQLWNDIFLWSQMKLGIPRGTIKACVLIENILSSFQMEEILYALREHSLGLNCGIWDYAASIICKFGHLRNFVLPDRNKYVNMERHFLKCYMQLVVRTCHRRGAHATGGMAALLLPLDKESQKATEIIEKVCQAKLKEIQEGVDGFMVYDIGLVPYVNELWRLHASSADQLMVKLSTTQITPEDLLQMPSGGVTMDGLNHNIAVTVLFIYHWFQGYGHFYYNGAVEDSATAEISRSQIWQWIRHETSVEDFNAVVTKTLVKQLAEKFLTCCMEGKLSFCQNEKERYQMKIAMGMFMEIITKNEFPDFITTYLNDNYMFWSFHKQ
ncbi:malate synthase isoform X2 [Anabrus simplex]|uniref:malate synthase isoform X2 n=1 Tax=Anabrus simplex TaxID=316456 RepID=UPI0035A3B3A9